jgi:hypothetical protein
MCCEEMTEDDELDLDDDLSLSNSSRNFRNSTRVSSSSVDGFGVCFEDCEDEGARDLE